VFSCGVAASKMGVESLRCARHRRTAQAHGAGARRRRSRRHEV